MLRNSDIFTSNQTHIFDIDDTLISTFGSYSVAQKEVAYIILQKHTDHIKERGSNQLKYLAKAFGTGNIDCFLSAFFHELRLANLTPEISLSQAKDEYISIFDKELNTFPSIINYLKLLSQNSKSLFIASNGLTHKQLNKLKKFGLQKFFDQKNIFISEQFSSSEKKPSPVMLNKIFTENTALSKASAVYYGDRESDIIAAKLAGVRAALVCINKVKNYNNIQNLNLAKPDYILDSWLL